MRLACEGDTDMAEVGGDTCSSGRGGRGRLEIFEVIIWLL